MGKLYFGASHTNNCKHILWGLFSPFNLFHCALSHDDSYPFLLSQALRTNDCIVTRQSPFVSQTTGCSVLIFVFVFRQPKKKKTNNLSRSPCLSFVLFVTLLPPTVGQLIVTHLHGQKGCALPEWDLMFYILLELPVQHKRLYFSSLY